MYSCRIFAIFITFFYFSTLANAQNSENVCANYKFERNLQKGSTGQDVYILQKILNEDSRTQVSQTGIGSKGQETKIFGEKTKLALKKFQALFIEYTNTADGNFQDKTRDLVNGICNNDQKIVDFFSKDLATTSSSTNEEIDPNFSDFLDQLPRAQAIEPKYIIEKYFQKLLNTLYPPQPIYLNNASTTASSTSSSSQTTAPQVTVSSVPF